MSLAILINIITSALQLAPLAISTVNGIRDLLSKDPHVPVELAAILASTETDNAAALAGIQRWMLEHPVGQ